MTLENASPHILEYEVSRLEIAIQDVSKLLEKYSDKPFHSEYYHTMQECFIALEFALRETRQIAAKYKNLSARLELLETLFNDWRKK